MKYILISLISISVSFAQVSTGDSITAKRFNESTLSIGTIQQSLLSETQFTNLQGNCWKLMNGQDVSGSDYAKLIKGDELGLNIKLPDARGLFLRAAGTNTTHQKANNSFYSGLPVGSFEEDAFQKHKHSFQNGVGWGAGDRGAGFGRADNNSPKNLWGGTVGSPLADGQGSPRTSDETRPASISVNYFVKVDHECQ